MADQPQVRFVVDRGAMRRTLTGPQSSAVSLIAKLQRRVVLNAKQRSPVDKGVLRNSHRADPIIVRGMEVTGSVTATASYAAAVHEGTRAHVIRPRNKRMLSWQGPSGQVFRRQVQHPGTRPRPWLRNAAQDEAARLGFQT